MTRLALTLMYRAKTRFAASPAPAVAGMGAAPVYRSEAFAEDLFDDADSPVPVPWSLGQALAAVALCALPVGLALSGGLVVWLGHAA